jgi:hypothetical protein
MMFMFIEKKGRKMVLGVAKEEDTLTKEIMTKLSVTDEKEEEVEKSVFISSIEKSLIGSSRKKKLIVLDLNGLIVDIVFPPPKYAKPDAIVARKACENHLFYFILLFINFFKFFQCIKIFISMLVS